MTKKSFKSSCKGHMTYVCAVLLLIVCLSIPQASSSFPEASDCASAWRTPETSKSAFPGPFKDNAFLKEKSLHRNLDGNLVRHSAQRRDKLTLPDGQIRKPWARKLR